jgi:hypothetical protein
MKKILLTTAIFAALYAGTATSHTINGGQLQANTDSFDTYHTSCFSWGDGFHPAAVAPEVNGPADHLRFTIRGSSVLPANAKVKLTVGKATGVAPQANISNSTIDNTNNDGSPLANDFVGNVTAPLGWATAKTLVGGNGDYTLVVTHGGTGANGYDIILHCQDAANNHTGTGSFYPGYPDNTASPNDDYDTLINF